MEMEAPPAAIPTTVHDIPVKVLQLIFLNLPSPLWIIRAAATCRRWRRIVTDSQFLISHGDRRHPHQVAGYYYHPQLSGGGSPTFVPASPEVAAAIDGRYFSLDFLPSGSGGSSKSSSWKLVDSKRSILLLARKTSGWMRHCFPDLIVCEPLTRRYRLIPRPEEMKRQECLGVFLEGCDSNDDMSYCRVICMLYESYAGLSGQVGTVRPCAFGTHRRMKTRGWKAGRSAAMDGLHLNLRGRESLQFVGRAGSSYFWCVKDEPAVRLVVFFNWAGFSLVLLPEHVQQLCINDTSSSSSLPFRVVGVRKDNDSVPRLVCTDGIDLKVFRGSYEYYHGTYGAWTLEKHLNLLSTVTRGLHNYDSEQSYSSGDDKIKISTVSGQCVVISSWASHDQKTRLFSVDIGTMEVKPWRKIMGSKRSTTVVSYYPYELPRPLRLRACLYHCKRRGRGPCFEICTCYN